MKIIDQLFSTNRFTSMGQKTAQEKTSGTLSGGFALIEKSTVEGMDRVEGLLRNLNHPVSEKEATSIEGFMQNSTGSVASKLETIEWATDKNVELSEDNLTAIHETLNNEMNESELIQTLSGTKALSEDETKSLIEKIKSDDSIPTAFKQKILTAVKQGMPIDKAVIAAVRDTLQLDASIKGRTVFIQGSDGSGVCLSVDQMLEVVTQAFEMIQSEAVQGFEDALKEAFVSLLGEDALVEGLEDEALLDDTAQVEETEEADINSMNTLQEDGETSASDDYEAFENEMIERLEASFEAVAYALVDQMGLDAAEATADVRFKSYLVEKVTENAIAAKEEFNSTRQEMVKALRDMTLEETPLSREEMQETLSKVIDKLDHMLMKSDVTLYTSMKMEKNLLNMSSELQEARKNLSKGDIAAAKETVKQVSSTLEKMIFKPSEKNIELMAYKQGAEMTGLKPSGLPTLSAQNTSMRGVLELFREMGLNHEPEVAEKLLGMGKKQGLEEDYKIKDNLKAVLLRLAEQEDVSSKRSIEGTEKALNNLTGQQLMNKLETKQDTQTLFFHIPVDTGSEIKDMRLFVNSRKNGDALDWENTSLYFSVDLKKYGETGILIQSKDRQLSINVRNDNAEFEDVMSPMVTALQKEFVDVGFKLGPVRFTSLNDTSPKDLIQTKDIEKKAQKVSYRSTPEKGFDFSI